MDFNNYFNGNFTFEKTKLGLTNINYIVTKENVKYFVKVYQNHIDNYEVQNNHLINNFDVPTITIDKTCKVTLAIKANTFENSSYTHEKLISFANTLKRFHGAKLVSKNIFSPFKQLRKYEENIKFKLVDYSEYESLVSKTKNYWEKAKKVFCHNDLVPGNILFANKCYIIDWEYSGMNDKLFDVASFINENNLKGTTAESIFLSWYFDSLDNDTLNALDMYDKFQSLLWSAWANMMYDQTGNSEFLDIFNDKIQRLKS